MKRLAEEYIFDEIKKIGENGDLITMDGIARWFYRLGQAAQSKDLENAFKAGYDAGYVVYGKSRALSEFKASQSHPSASTELPQQNEQS